MSSFRSRSKGCHFSIPTGKSLGPNGFSAEFFRVTWHIVRRDVCHAIKDFFSSSKMLKSLNATLISLVPKVTCPRTVADYRPIAYCNTVYKAITKIITARMQRVMPELIDEV